MKGKDMGGYGSGRHSYRQKVEHLRVLDICRMNRHGVLKPGCACKWQWTVDGQQTAYIDLEARENAVVLSFRFRKNNSAWQSVEQLIPLEHMPCNFGGSRAYFRCPGPSCGKRVTKLYSGGPRFLCRHCYDLAYRCQSEVDYDRLLRQSNKLRMSMGGEPGCGSCIPSKPKNMHWRTYQKRVDRIYDLEHRATQMLIETIGHRLNVNDLDLLKSWA